MTAVNQNKNTKAFWQDSFPYIIISIGAVLCFCAYFFISPIKVLHQNSFANSFCILVVCIAVLLICSLFFRKLIKIESPIIFAALLAVSAAALAMRLYFFDSASGDYNSFLSRWVEEMRFLPGVEAIVKPIGDYNMPYLYFLFIVSKTSLYDLYLIKLFSVIFDFVLAFGLSRLVYRLKGSVISSILAFAFVLFIPTVFLNSAMWAQCDAIYAAFCVWALYFALSKKGRVSIIFFALAFSFKMQSIFIFPVIIFLVLKNKIKLSHLLYFPLTFVATLIPAILCGRSIYDTFSIYINQTESYPALTLNCPTLWAFFPEESFEVFGTAALFLAGAGVVCFCVYLYYNRAKLDTSLLFDAAYLFSLLLPFLLPRMHERYFYLAEALSVAYMLLHRKRAFIPPLLLFTTFDCYSAYLFGYRFIDLWQLAIINAAVIFYLLYKFIGDVEAKVPVYLPEKSEAEL